MERERVILLVEDDLPVRKLVSEILHRAGHEVVSASSGPDAIRAFNQWNGRIHLLITDVDLSGGMSGVDLAEHLAAIRSDLKVLLMSGTPRESIALTGIMHFISKPFLPADLVETVEQVLTHAEGGLPLRRDCAWIENLLSRRYPGICIDCREVQVSQYLLRLRLRPEAPPKEVRFSMREYLDGGWEKRVEAAIGAL